MGESELLQRCGVAIAIGLLIGIERGWQERRVRDGGRVAGIRTFTLIGVLGAVSGLLSGRASPVLLGFCFLSFALPLGWFEWRRAQQARSVSATDFVAGLLTFALGALAVIGDMTVAAAAAVIAAVILAERQAMHSFLRSLRWPELRAGLILLVMTAVLLPALPNRTIDPWGALNPHELWLMTVLAGAVCYGGYMAIRLAGSDKGLLYAGVMGGLVTSTTVTWTFARLARRDARLLPGVTTAILAAWIVSLLRMTGLAAAFAPGMAAMLALPVAAACVVLLAGMLWFHRANMAASAAGLQLNDPLELSLIMRFMILLAAVMLAGKWISAHTGPAGLITFGGASGLLDVDPITLSMAHSDLAPRLAASTILTAAVANGLAKAFLGFVFGGTRMGLILGSMMLAASTAGAMIWFL